MSRYFIPGLLFGCSAVPATASSNVDMTIVHASVEIEPFSETAVGVGSNGAPSKTASGWSERFGFWSGKSRAAMVDAINAESRESAELLELTALSHVWKALSTISDHELARLKVSSLRD